MKSPVERMQTHLSDVYGEAEAAALLPRLAERLDAFKQQNPDLSIGRQAAGRSAFGT